MKKIMCLDNVKEIYLSCINPYIEEQEYHWRRRRNNIFGHLSSEFFIGVMLDQQQKVPRNNCAACNLVNFNPKLSMRGTYNNPWYKAFWEKICEMNVSELKNYCRFTENMEETCQDCDIYNHHKYQGFYAGIKCNSFPEWLKNNAKIIINEYGGRVENIWNYATPTNAEEASKIIDECTERFKRFDGIGNALANMAVFILARDYGHFGGDRFGDYFKIKDDVHVQRVVSKLFFARDDYEENKVNVYSAIEILNTCPLPPNTDLALWRIGINFCQYNNCQDCPFNKYCKYSKKNKI